MPGKFSTLIRVGTSAVPRSAISAISSSVSPVPCSMQSMPARISPYSASVPNTCAVTLAPAAHAAGARVTAHVFGTDALYGLIRAGIDCIEHGTGLTDELIAEMAERGTALVPTLINVENFPGIASAASKYPAYAAHMRALYDSADDVVRRAVQAGVPVYAGTDAGGGIGHGRIAEEIVALR